MADITLDDGMRVLEAAFAKARSLDLVVGVSVVDARGDLVASARMDGSLWWWTESSRAKAMATVTYGGLPSGELLERASGPVAQALVHMHQGRMAPQQGAVPIRKGDKLVGRRWNCRWHGGRGRGYFRCRRVGSSIISAAS